MLAVILVIVVAMAAQFALTYCQMRDFSREFAKLKRRGRVTVGRKSGGFHAGAIVMFLLDGDGIILEGKALEGVSSFARVKDLPGYEGRDICDLRASDAPKGHRNLGKALEDAARSYGLYVSGKPIPEPVSPIQSVGKVMGGLLGRERVSKDYQSITTKR